MSWKNIIPFLNSLFIHFEIYNDWGSWSSMRFPLVPYKYVCERMKIVKKCFENHVLCVKFTRICSNSFGVGSSLNARKKFIIRLLHSGVNFLSNKGSISFTCCFQRLTVFLEWSISFNFSFRVVAFNFVVVKFPDFQIKSN